LQRAPLSTNNDRGAAFMRPLRMAAIAAIQLLALALAPAAAAGSPAVPTLRVMLAPSLAAPGALPTAAAAHLRAVTAAPLTLAGTTRTGALELALPLPADPAAVLARLRNDRSVLWAEVVDRAANTRARPKFAAGEVSRKLMVRLADGVALEEKLQALSARAGVALHAERRIGNVHVLALDGPVPLERLAAIAQSLEADPAVRYADPVRRAHALRVPNDPMFAQQWSLADPVGGIDAPAAWDLATGDASITVAVVDTGIQPHPDLDDRLLPGYDFISDPDNARDGDGRDPDPADTGDFRHAGDCGDPFDEPSTWHGTRVAGLIGASSDNGIGIAGVDWHARILPVRVLGKCGGTFDDILAGMLWASGAELPGIPVNRTPAKVINLSLGGNGACDAALQEAIDDALAQGSVVVVAAGNSSADATSFAPASCSGVITVGATGRGADRASYSNFGARVDLSAPGGDLTEDGLIVSTGNDGATVAGNPGYERAAGTSFASPLVAGTLSLMLARNPLLTPGRALGILQGTARPYPIGTSCQAGACGAGILDAGLALASTVPGTQSPPAGAVPVIEYYRADLDHYFITASAAEAAWVDANLARWFKRTGFLFYAYPDAASAPAGAHPVCRFYAGGLINSHYYTASASECAYVQAHWAGVWNLETRSDFYVPMPDDAGTCPAGTLPVYRFFDNRNDANHRYTVDLSIRRAMQNRGWVPEGAGPNGVAFCSPV
jgi:serine protease